MNAKLLKIFAKDLHAHFKYSQYNIMLQPGTNLLVSGQSRNELELFYMILSGRGLQSSVFSPPC